MTRRMLLLTTLALVLFLFYVLVYAAAGQADAQRSEGAESAHVKAAAPSGVPTLGGKTIREWKRSADFHGDWVRRLQSANRNAIKLSDAGVVKGLNCIHSHEGRWNDPNSPHWGGLQMDETFQKQYGAELYRHLGTADKWPAVAQLAVGVVAYYSGRGFGPWPNTRRKCGI